MGDSDLRAEGGVGLLEERIRVGEGVGIPC